MKNTIFLENITNIHFIGIGGISTSALAKLMLSWQKNVTGSDIAPSNITRELEKMGIKVFIGHKRKYLKDAQLVVYTGAIKKDNPEFVFAKSQNIPTLERSEFLALVAKEYTQVIAISGTHGKTSTCALLASIFISAKKEPTVHIGGKTSLTNGNLLIGKKDFFITEACEYKNSFLTLNQDVGVILNIENDHTDYFKNILDLYRSFGAFFNKSKFFNVIEEGSVNLIEKIHNNFVTFCAKGLKSDSSFGYTAKNIRLNKNFDTSFEVYYKDKFLGEFKIKSPLFHNISNALAALAVARFYKIPIKYIKEGLSKFSGVKRRFEKVGILNQALVIHDYAHHPTEIENMISSCKSIFKKQVVCVFQPHTFSRTKALFEDFLKALKLSDKVYFYKTYPAREKYDKNSSAKSLYKELKTIKESKYFSSFKKMYEDLSKNTSKKDLILILGAGDIENFAYDYFK